MSFGGHHAKDASDKLQKKLQAMATDQELQDGLAGIDIRDDEDMDIDRQKLAKKMQDDLSSIAASANAEDAMNERSSCISFFSAMAARGASH
jgi:hypothetical protein